MEGGVGRTLFGWVLIQLPKRLGAPDEPAVHNLDWPLGRLKTFILPESHLAGNLDLCARQGRARWGEGGLPERVPLNEITLLASCRARTKRRGRESAEESY